MFQGHKFDTDRNTRIQPNGTKMTTESMAMARLCLLWGPWKEQKQQNWNCNNCYYQELHKIDKFWRRRTTCTLLLFIIIISLYKSGFLSISQSISHVFRSGDMAHKHMNINIWAYNDDFIDIYRLLVQFVHSVLFWILCNSVYPASAAKHNKRMNVNVNRFISLLVVQQICSWILIFVVCML